ncbi:MAG: DUF6797 domain-containing protein [Aureliella sp.]
MKIRSLATTILFMLVFLCEGIEQSRAEPRPPTTQGTLTSQLRTADLTELIARINQKGDAVRGAVLFHRATLQCATCHAVDDSQSPLGPNLATWESKPPTEHIIQSILNPSDKISDGFKTLQVLTSEEQVVSGILKEETDSSIVLYDASRPGQTITYAKDDLEAWKTTKQSLMPEGLVDQLRNTQEFYDLVKYVVEVSRKGPVYAASIQPSPALTALPPLPDYEERVDHRGLIASWDGESLQRGKAIYRRVCANCHGTKQEAGSLPTSPRFATGKLKQGSDPYTMYRTLTHGAGLMVAQRWMVPQQKYDVIHYIREAYFKDSNPTLYTEVESDYLETLPTGDTFGPEPSRYEPYVAMNYGSSLINTYEITFNNDGEKVGRDLGRNPSSRDPWANPDPYFEPGETPNYAYKGIAVRLDEGPGGITRGSQWVVYDHDTMQMHAAWEGSGFIDYCCIQFDGQHNTHNRLVGRPILSNPVGPGWGQPLTGVFHDPRPVGRDGRPYGPLPREWYRFQGIYHHGLNTILSYRVGAAQILESPTRRIRDAQGELEGNSSRGPIIIERRLSVGPAPHQLKLLVASQDINVAATQDAQAEIVEESGQLYLVIPARDQHVDLSVFVSESPIPDALIDEPALDLRGWTKGGPPRWGQIVETPIVTTFNEEFSVDQLTLPSSNPWNAQVRATGIDFLPDPNQAVVCTWDGDVWIVTGLKQDAGTLKWRRIATGLFQPLGIRMRGGEIFVTCRDQLVRLHDLNGDEEIDYYECFNSDHQVTEHFHEFAMGLQTDDAGNFYYAKSGRHAKRAVVPHHGTLLQVAADGSSTSVLATGFRAANGVCLNPDGTFFVTDQEGHWNPKNRINRVQKGGFYGNMYSFTEVLDPSDDAMDQPLCWITNAFDRSPAELLWVPKDKWGVFGGSLLNLSYGYGKVFLVPHEEVYGQLQGGMIQLPIPDAASGLIRGRFHPTRDELYACGMFSWAGSRQAPGCFYRIRYNHVPVHLPVQLSARTDALELKFSHTLDATSTENPAAFEIKTWDLRRTPNYGSKHFNEQTLDIAAVDLLDDAKTVVLTIPDLKPTWGMSITYELIGAKGRKFTGELHNSIYQLGSSQ